MFELVGAEEQSGLALRVVELGRDAGGNVHALALVVRVHAFGLEGTTRGWFDRARLAAFQRDLGALLTATDGQARAATLEATSPERVQIRVASAGRGAAPELHARLEIRRALERTDCNALLIGFTLQNAREFARWLGDVTASSYLDALEGAGFDSAAVASLRPSATR